MICRHRNHLHGIRGVVLQRTAHSLPGYAAYAYARLAAGRFQVGRDILHSDTVNLSGIPVLRFDNYIGIPLGMGM